jgi:peptidoglycan/xylan/chitin deacetylase (PgdA/CDA1 family)
MRVSAAIAASMSVACLVIAGCGDSTDEPEAQEGTPAARTPRPAPDVKLTRDERRLWAELKPDRSAIPVLLYHGIGPESDFSNATDAEYGIGFEDFAHQMTAIRHAGYETVDLETFIDFVGGKSVELPPRPLLLTFDDARADSWTGGDGILRELGFTAVMFVDVGRVENGDPAYLTWPELQTAQDSGRWQLQLHSGEGHQQIGHGPGEDDYGPYYAYREQGEDFEGWRERVRSDIEWGQQTVADNISAYRPLAFAPPYGNYGQDGSNDPRIAGDLRRGSCRLRQLREALRVGRVGLGGVDGQDLIAVVGQRERLVVECEFADRGV